MNVKDKEEVELDLQNRRQFGRVRAQLALQYRILNEEGAARAWNSTVTKNLSAAGICFESFHPLRLNAELEVNLKIPFFEAPVVMKARIVRAAEIKAGEIYGVAAAITAIKQSDRQKLQVEIEQIDIMGLLQLAMQEGATDVHLSMGHFPMLRRAGQLELMKYDVLDRVAIKRMIFSLLNEDQIHQLQEKRELNTAVTIVTIAGTYRFRLNVHYQQDIVEAAFHFINIPIPSIEELKLPEIISKFADTKAGLVLIAGPGGCGKTTTCASLIEKINSERSSIIMTFQSPLEYIFPVKNSIIKQREIGVDTESFAAGIKQAMQQDVDVIVLSEIPDQSTLELAIDASLSGKLVFMVLSGSGVVAALNKLINMFPTEKHYYIRKLLSNCLKGVVFQKLLPMKGDKEKQIVITEIIFNDQSIANAIQEGLLDKIPSIIKNNANRNMISMDNSINELLKKGLITTESVKTA